MKVTIDCAISIGLQESVGGYTFSHISKPPTYLNPNDEWTRGQYCLLILDKRHYDLYTEPRYRSENLFDVVGYYDVLVNRPEDIDAVCHVLLELLVHPGVLTYSQIRTLMKLRILVYDGSEDRIEGASYDLVVDREFLRSGVAIEEADTITINPFDHVVVGAKESVNLPKNICATFDLAVKLFCRGMILSNGPQVDPGYSGRLLCLLFNTSAKEYAMLAYQDFKYATIQFQTLSESTTNAYAGSHQRKRHIRDYIAEYTEESMGNRMLSMVEMQGQNEKLSREVSALSARIDKTDTKIDISNRILMALSSVGVIVAIVGLIAMGGAIYYSVQTNYLETQKGDSRVKSDISALSKQMDDMGSRIQNLETKRVK